MNTTFTSLDQLKKSYPTLLPFYTQSWVYAGITAYFSSIDQFDLLEFTSVFNPDLVIKDWNHYSDQLGPAQQYKYYGQVYEGHPDYWLDINRARNGTVIISGHEHFETSSQYTSLGFDYWDIQIYNEFRHAAFGYEINHSSVTTALYDIVVAVGTPRPHKILFMETLKNHSSTLTVVTDDAQNILDTDLRFNQLGLEVYFNKVGAAIFDHTCYPSFFDTNLQRSLHSLPHKKMHSIARVNIALEGTAYSTDMPYITEKTWKILAQCRPFVVYGDTNVLSKLQKQGFRTFATYCDESYDQETDEAVRAEKTVEAMKQLLQACIRYPRQIDEICQHNQRLFFEHNRHTDNLARFGQKFLHILNQSQPC